ncbi:hypothetical protein ACJIZ3_006178 [Penstemon smallii]|uniref:Uncharacterized protein n=1 Tax=Penstemon smallii TaxID=265156 RepID=A0ABD3S7E7_9LAMI
MDGSSFCGTSCSEDGNSVVRCISNNSLGDRVSIDELSNDLMEKLNVDVAVGDIIDEHYIDEFGDEDEDEDEDEEGLSEEALLVQMGYINEPCVEEEELEEPFLAQMNCLKKEPPGQEPSSTPTTSLNLVSALKGSRAKEGKPDMECRVTWSPDVYDQPHTPPEHFATDKIERHKSEHKVKGADRRNRQKSCSSKGYGASEGKGARKDKDKKRGKKRGGNSSRCSGYDED